MNKSEKKQNYDKNKLITNGKETNNKFIFHTPIELGQNIYLLSPLK